ncbi:uncharacterized protein LOC118466103 isoform X2 [Anopheles albimanus]|uniref:uncharacterized protein LOC118466103 isoform X2 n=1 Tax=Anopheles albimanus TaxID=7167 RepID=UPI001640A3B5|nr:uncharacterized protein LOC118466103 isoform X2 [Anopheles albimanus]
MEIVDVTGICRLCMGDLCTPTTASIDMLNFPDIRSLVKDHYSVEILATDKCTTSICMECYMKLQKRNEFRLKYKSYKKRFRMNQLILRGQMEAFSKQTTTQKTRPAQAAAVEAAAEDPTEVAMVDTPEVATVDAPEVATVDKSSEVTIVVEDAHESLEEPITEEQFEAQVAHAVECQVAPTPAVDTEPQEEATDDTDAATERSDDTMDEHVAMASLDILRPVLVDCLKEPLYLEALKPVYLSKDPNRSLDYHCPKCFHVFTKRNYLYKHLKRNTCFPSCRYSIAGQIWAKSRYRSDAIDTSSAVRESDTESEASTVDLPLAALVDATRPK